MISQICAAIARDAKASLKRQRKAADYDYWAAVGGMTGAVGILAWLLWEVYGR